MQCDQSKIWLSLSRGVNSEKDTLETIRCRGVGVESLEWMYKDAKKKMCLIEHLDAIFGGIFFVKEKMIANQSICR